MEQPYMLPILYCQYHACWCPGDLMSPRISRNGIDPESRNIPYPAASEEFKWSWSSKFEYMQTLLLRALHEDTVYKPGNFTQILSVNPWGIFWAEYQHYLGPSPEGTFCDTVQVA